MRQLLDIAVRPIFFTAVLLSISVGHLRAEDAVNGWWAVHPLFDFAYRIAAIAL